MGNRFFHNRVVEKLWEKYYVKRNPQQRLIFQPLLTSLSIIFLSPLPRLCVAAHKGGGKVGLYKVDLPDGDYIIRKLTPVEAERCQTLPDDYTAFGVFDDDKIKKISATQRYKCVGNAWTVDVIAHILSYSK